MTSGNITMECREQPQLAYHGYCAVHEQPLVECSNERLRQVRELQKSKVKKADNGRR